MHTTRIIIVGIGDAKTKALRENLLTALNRYPVNIELSHVSNVHEIALSGATQIPALKFDGQIVSEGEVPTVQDLLDLLRNRTLYRSKLFMIDKILVPTDFSVSSENAFQYALQLAEMFDAKVHLVHVCDTLFEDNEIGQYRSSYAKKLTKELATLQKKYFKGVEEPEIITAKKLSVTNQLHFGYPERVLPEISSKYDMIIMGSSGESNVMSRLLGSVSTDVAQKAHCPVLIVPPKYKYKLIKNLLYASNFESKDLEKMRQVVGFSKKIDAQIHFVHVGDMPTSKEAFERELFKNCYEDTLATRPFLFKHVLDEGSLSKTLNHYAKQKDIDLSVVVTHRRGLLERYIHKSAAKDMIYNGSHPILVVHQFNDVRKNS